MDDMMSIRSRCDILLENAIANNDQQRIKQMQAINKFLRNDNCFVAMDKEFCLFLLMQLGYSEEQAIQIYDAFNNVEFYDGTLEYVGDNGELVILNSLLNPEVEEYYRFVRGNVFKYNKMEDKFYAFSNGRWEFDADLERKFYDVGYDYVSIKCHINKKNIGR